MADKYERWNAWAPRYIADLINDFQLADWQASALVGNLAAESAYFNDITEDRPLITGSRGGYGHAQHTGPRRKRLEAWLARKGWSGDSYEGNYSYIFRELKGLEPGLDYRHVINRLKTAVGATDEERLRDATERFAKHFEAPAVINVGPRFKAAKEALALYRKNPPRPTAWPTDRKDPMPVPTPIPTPVQPSTPSPGPVVPVPVPPVPPVIPGTDEKPAIPWYKSQVLWGVLISAIGKAIAIIWPKVGWTEAQTTQLVEIVTLAASFLGDFIAVHGRLSSSAQHITGTEGGADRASQRIANERAAITVAAATKEPVALPPAAAAEWIQGAGRNFEGPPALASLPEVALQSMPLEKLASELPQVAQLAATILSTMGSIQEALSKINQPSRPPV